MQYKVTTYSEDETMELAENIESESPRDGSHGGF